jgi:8-oxo-dGTP pyrophosphatase MutT (NUDIX family)
VTPGDDPRRATVRRELRAVPGGAHDGVVRDLLGALDTGQLTLDRGGRPIHLTAGAAVLDAPGRHVLLVRHQALGRWVQPGGHVEAVDPSLAAAALREAAEETGQPGLRLWPGPLAVSRYPAPCAPPGAAEHADVQFLITCPFPPAGRPGHAPAARWFPVGALPAGVDASVRRLVAAALWRLAAGLPTGAVDDH